LNRLDRLIAICFASKIQPVVILTKIDIAEKSELADRMAQIDKRFNDISIFLLSNKSMEGFPAIQNMIEYGKTYCFIGSDLMIYPFSSSVIKVWKDFLLFKI